MNQARNERQNARTATSHCTIQPRDRPERGAHEGREDRRRSGGKNGQRRGRARRLRRAGQRIILPYNSCLDQLSICCLDGYDCGTEFVLGHNSRSTGV